MMPIGLLALSLTAFAIGTSEFVIAGILPISDFGVSIATTGLLVPVYAAAVAIGGPILAMFTAGLPRKPLIVLLLAVFCAGQAFCAMAPSYSWLMAGRVFSACSHGLFFGTGSVAAMNLVPPQKRGVAMALFLGGITVANLLGLPAGTAIGNAFGWRWTFCAVGACGLAATGLVARLLPSGPVHREHATSLRAAFRALNHHQVYLSYLLIILAKVGTLAFATYQVPAMIEVTGIPQYRHLASTLISTAYNIGIAGGAWAVGSGSRMVSDIKPFRRLASFVASRPRPSLQSHGRSIVASTNIVRHQLARSASRI